MIQADHLPISLYNFGYQMTVKNCAKWASHLHNREVRNNCFQTRFSRRRCDTGLCRVRDSGFFRIAKRNNIARRLATHQMQSMGDTVQYFLASLGIGWQEIVICAVALHTLRKIMTFALSNCDLDLFSKRDPPSNAFKGKVVWIVGASKGLGQELALHFASLGAKLILSSRSVEKLELVKLKCLQYALVDDVVILPLDITAKYSEIETVTDEAFKQFGKHGVDYIIHNAGASQHAAVEETNYDVARELIEKNLMGQIAVARASLPAMLKNGKGHHIVIASMAACVPSPGQAVYSAAKSALKSYFLSLSSELSSRGIYSTVVCPGPIHSDESEARMVYGKDGLIPQKNTSNSKKRVSVKVVAHLVAKAAYHRMDECWISNHPILLMGYLVQYLPKVAMRLLKKIGPGRVKQFNDGKGTGYEFSKMLK